MSSIDNIDTKILDMLETDGRKSFTQIAKKLGLSEATIRKRVFAMQKKKVIMGFTVKVNPTKLGLNTGAIVGVDIDPTKLLTVAQNLCTLKETKCVATASGDHMVMLEIWTQNARELTKLLTENIEKMEGVKRVCPALILEKLKG